MLHSPVCFHTAYHRGCHLSVKWSAAITCTSSRQCAFAWYLRYIQAFKKHPVNSYASFLIHCSIPDRQYAAAIFWGTPAPNLSSARDISKKITGSTFTVFWACLCHQHGKQQNDRICICKATVVHTLQYRSWRKTEFRELVPLCGAWHTQNPQLACLLVKFGFHLSEHLNTQND
jgi:hypothetical protein